MTTRRTKVWYGATSRWTTRDKPFGAHATNSRPQLQNVEATHAATSTKTCAGLHVISAALGDGRPALLPVAAVVPFPQETRYSASIGQHGRVKTKLPFK